MATGPEHYREAERLLAARNDDNGEGGWMARAQMTAEARVHGLLALVAAVALPGQHPGDWEREIWAFSPDGEPDPEDAPEPDGWLDADDPGSFRTEVTR